MKLTAQQFLSMLNNEGITCSVQDGHIALKGTDTKLITTLYEMLDKSPDFEAGIIRHLNIHKGISLREYQLALESAGMRISLEGLYTLKFTGGKDKARIRLMSILDGNSYLKAAVILSIAMKDSNLLDMIQERACIRWENGYSDSLLMAVLSGIAATGETVKRNNGGQILLRKKCNIVLSTLFRVFLVLSSLMRHFLPLFALANQVDSAVLRLSLPP